MPATGDDLRKAMGQFATGVTVVLTRDDQSDEATVYGMTANAITSVSLNPPQVLLCVGRDRYMHGVLSRIGRFSISILNQDQEPVSRYFAGQREERFERVVAYCELEGGLPGVKGALAWVECRIVAEYAGGDHTILLGEVTGATAAGGKPLLFFNSGYHHLAGS